MARWTSPRLPVWRSVASADQHRRDADWRYQRIKLSANWMAAAGHPGQMLARDQAVKAVGEEAVSSPRPDHSVGKDSMSMKTRWQEGSEQREMTSPLSLVITVFARGKTCVIPVTPQLVTETTPCC
ncbi:hypothetical protein ACNKHS_15470 [Shigella flexneri]